MLVTGSTRLFLSCGQFKVCLNRYSWSARKQVSEYISWFRILTRRAKYRLHANFCANRTWNEGRLNINAKRATSVKSYLKTTKSTIFVVVLWFLYTSTCTHRPCRFFVTNLSALILPICLVEISRVLVMHIEYPAYPISWVGNDRITQNMVWSCSVTQQILPEKLLVSSNMLKQDQKVWSHPGTKCNYIWRVSSKIDLFKVKKKIGKFCIFQIV